MPSPFAFRLLSVVLLPALSTCIAATTFYVDSANGKDTNDGLSPQAAWLTLDRVNAATFGPGDKILFKADSRFSGRLSPKGSGTATAPIVVASYGKGEKPLIAAAGRFHEALLLQNQDYWDVTGLQFTNTGATREPFRYGVRVRSWDHGIMRQIRLRDLDVHDVNGSLVKKDKGEGHGIVWENGGDRVKSSFDGLLIERCHLVRTDRNGICGFTPYPSADRSVRSRHVVIRGNLLEDIGGDGIKVWGCDGAIVEHNVLRGARTRCDDYAAGIWPWACDNTVIQFNEVSGVKGARDGEAFDSDAYTTNSLYQYNYTHDNDGGFMLICCFSNTGTVVRYNISQNDHARLFHMAGSNDTIRIYNNVFYIGDGSDVQLFLWTGGREGWTRNTHIINNIFYSKGTGRNANGTKKKAIDDGTFLASPGFGGAEDVVFERNLLYGNFVDIPEAWRKMVADPKLAAPGSGKDGYKLLPGSPAIGAGLLIENNGGRDFWGNPLPKGKSPSIGAYEPH